MEVRTLGPLAVADASGQVVEIASPNQRTLLAVLTACRPRAVEVDVLVDAIWGDDPPRTAVSTLRTYTSRLRTLLGPVIETSAGGYALAREGWHVDADRFETLLEEAHHVAPSRAVALLVEALGMWRGPAFGDRSDLDAVRAEARRLDELRSTGREMKARALLESGRAGDAVADSEALVADEPLREGAWVVLMEALTAADRHAEALRAYQRAAETLAGAGLEPSARLRTAERAAVEGTVPASARRQRPPRQLSSLVGRDADVDAIADLVASTRLVTLVGPGGVGKTRLALEVASRTWERRLHGACVIDLAAVDRPDEVPTVVVAGLGLATDAREATHVLTRIGALDVLVVVDNAEHLVGAVAELVTTALRGGDAATFLVTSRERLAVDGENVWRVDPLATADAAGPAAQLLRERAAAVGSDVPDDLAARMAQQLDGLPLAIEMAAGQLAVTTPVELAAELDEHLDSLRLDRRSAPARHQSLAAVLEWSEAHLDASDARVLAELAVFAGPITVHDVAAVLGADAVERVRLLAARSLVQVDREHGPVRFRLLQTVRSFAAQRLAAAGVADALAARHAEHFASVAQDADARLRTDDELKAVERIESVMAELRAAFAWALDHDLDCAAAIAAHLQPYAQWRFVDEPLAWAERLLDRTPTAHPHRPVLLAAAATRALRRADIAEARRLAIAGIALAGSTRAALPALDALADAGMFDGHLTECTATARRMGELAERLDEPHYLALAHSGMSLAPAYGGARDEAAEAAVRALARRHLPPSARGWVAYTLGELAQATDPHVALAHIGDALAIARSVGNRYLEGVAIVSSCSLRARVGEADDALSTFGDAIRHWLRLANVTQQVITLRNLVVLFQRIGWAEPAAELLGALAAAPIASYGDDAQRVQEVRAWSERELGVARFATVADRGAARDVTAAAITALRVIAEPSGRDRRPGLDHGARST